MGFFLRLSSKEEKNLELRPLLNYECQIVKEPKMSLSDIIVATFITTTGKNVQKTKKYRESVECLVA